MLRRPSHFVTVSNLVSRQDLDAREKGGSDRKGGGDRNTTISVSTLQDELPRNRKQKSSLKGLDKRSEPSISESKSSKSISSKEIKKPGEQIKKDILDYLNNLIEKTEWLVLLFNIKD